MRTHKLVGIALVVVIAGTQLNACSTKTGTGAAIGGIGAALLTGSVQTAALGAAAGAGIGYLSEQEQQKQREAAQREQEALERSRITSDVSTAYRPKAANPLVGSTWRVISLSGERESEFAEYSQIIYTFQTNTKATSLYSKHDGTSEAFVENYGIVDDVLVFRGTYEGGDYTIAGKFTKNEDLLSVDFGDLKVVLEEIQETG